MSLVDDSGCTLPCATHRTIFISSSTISLVVVVPRTDHVGHVARCSVACCILCMLLPLWLWLLPEQLFGDG
jgi:hypothetical protein